MWKLGLALGLFSLVGCGATDSAPPVETFALHQGPIWPAGARGSTLVHATAKGFMAWGVDADGTVVFRMSGTAPELDDFTTAIQRETGATIGRCMPGPTGDINGGIPCPTGPTGLGSGTGGGHTVE